MIVIAGALAYPCPGSTILTSKTFSFATPTLPHALTGRNISEAIAVLPAVTAKNLGVALLLTGLGFWLFSVWRAPSLPDAAPEWTLPALNGGEISLSDYRGQTIVLNF